MSDTIESQEQAFIEQRDAGEVAVAARIAANLAWDVAVQRGDLAISKGWIARADRLLADSPESTGHAWRNFHQGQLDLYFGNDLQGARANLVNAKDAARRLGDLDAEMGSISQLGLIDVMIGSTESGMRALDEAAAVAVSGEIKKTSVAGGIVCDMIFACEFVRDVDRASQWCRAAESIAEDGRLSPLLSACRAHYASVLVWTGDWDAAEETLDEACDLSARYATGIAREGTLRMAELRILQGRLDEAWSLFETVEWTPAAKLGKARIAFERGDVAMANDLFERHVRALAPAETVVRVPGLELACELAIVNRDFEAADAAAAELTTIAEAAGSELLKADAELALARVAAAQNDHAAADAHFERAIDLWCSNASPFRAAIARAEHAATLTALGRKTEAAAELERANTVIQELRKGTPPPPPGGLLSARETEVLALVAEGFSDDQVAEKLFVSPHTVHRHMANIRNKLDQPSRTAAVARAARDGLI